MKYFLKQASLDEVDETLNLYNKLIDELDKGVNYPKWTRDFYPNRLYLNEKARTGELFLLQKDDQIIGSTVLNTDRIEDYKKIPWTMEDLSEDEILTIHTFAVKEELRGQGLGKVFIELIEDYAKENGLKAIRLDTIFGNVPAVRFYEKTGYTNLGQHELHYDETDETRFILFEKNLMENGDATDKHSPSQELLDE